MRTKNTIRTEVALLLASFLVFSFLLYGGVNLIEEKSAAPAEATNGGVGLGVVADRVGGPARFEVVAKDLKFDKTVLTSAIGADVTITFDNEDPGIPHNIAFYTNSRAIDKLFVMDTFAGSASQTGAFKAPSRAGNYFYRCDVHPNMKGTLIVK